MRNNYRNKAPKRKKSGLGGLFLLLLAIAAIGGLVAWFMAPRAETAEALTGKISPVQAQKPETPEVIRGFPGDTSVSRILQSVLKLWVDALLSGDYKEFHSSLAPSWKAKDSPDSLASAYMNLKGYKDVLAQFPGRGKLVLLESGPYDPHSPELGPKSVRDSVGPESPWLIRGEWRTGKTTLNITLLLSLEAEEWKPVGLRLEVYDRSA
ncbi:MAG: hypothetical protein LBF40_06030 [Deltaproteobacteria bacterium]|jgi:hypothetical protein|nr:hypothetical protein [Deltaproteobacteria bacterium]